MPDMSPDRWLERLADEHEMALTDQEREDILEQARQDADRRYDEQRDREMEEGVKYYAIKRPDGSWIMGVRPMEAKTDVWHDAMNRDADLWRDANLERRLREDPIARAESAGYRCVEVSGFVEVEK